MTTNVLSVTGQSFREIEDLDYSVVRKYFATQLTARTLWIKFEEFKIENKSEYLFDYSLIASTLKRTVFCNGDLEWRLPNVKMIAANIDSYFSTRPFLLSPTSASDCEKPSITQELRQKILSKADIDESLDVIMDEFASILAAGNYRSCDEILKEISLDGFSVDHLIGILTVTNSFKADLSERDSFYSQVFFRLCDELGTSKAIKLLRGLD